MSARAALLFTLAAGPLLATCASDPNRQEASSELCRFGQRQKPTLMGYVDKTGAAYEGEIPVADYGKFPGRVASAVAAPRSKTYRLRVPKTCHNKAGDYYYSCPTVIEVDLTKVRAISRGPTRARTDRLAIQLCQLQARQLAAKETGYDKVSTSLTCQIVESETCTLDMAKFKEQQKDKGQKKTK